jgi:hypothetical protein
MVDRQDIDALLIGALYGELTLADEARLTAHLESHPADRSALAGMTSTRDAVRESRIFQVQLDPPQSVSALLLQEAARRAPRRAPVSEHREGWFQRFVHSFMAHPAMAAAAMLVLVVGVAGTMYLRHGDQFADREAPAVTAALGSAAPADHSVAANGVTAQQVNEAPTPESKTESKNTKNDEALAKDAPAAATGSAYRVDLDGDLGNARTRGDNLKLSPPSNKGAVVSDTKRKLLEVRTIEPTPKEIEPAKPTPKPARADQDQFEDKGGETKQELQKSADRSDDGVASNAPGQGQGAQGSKFAGPHTTAPSHTAPPTAPPPADAKPDVAAAVDLAWAKDQHTHMKALAHAGNCPEAGKLAVTILARAPDYYKDSVATDRELKQCLPYIDQARSNDAEKAAKARAQKRNSTNEPMPAPSQDLK